MVQFGKGPRTSLQSPFRNRLIFVAVFAVIFGSINSGAEIHL